MPVAAARPILKWAGGKRQLLPQLRRYYPASFARYVEPFAGSAAVFLDLHNSGRLDGKEVRLSDINADVIGCYLAVRRAVESVIDHLLVLEREHLARGPEYFYEVRDDRFNVQRRRLGGEAASYSPQLAAMLIYLNRTGYNGLFRVNSLGDFNVPVGRHRSLRICDADNLRCVSAALGRPGVVLEVRPFEDALAAARRDDFVYLDPPYAPLSRTAHFTSYTRARFGADEQARLQRTVVDLAGRGVGILLSNSAAPEIRRLYAESGEVRRAGLTTRTVRARRAINSRASRRGAILEYLITNVPAGRAAAARGGAPSSRKLV